MERFSRYRQMCRTVSQFGRETVIDVAQDHPEVELTHMYVDNDTMQLIREPKQFDVILTGNILSGIILFRMELV